MLKRRWLVSVGVVCVLATAVQIIIYSPTSPEWLSSSSKVPLNNILQGAEKIGEGNLYQPEDVCVGKDGVLYTATRDGWVKKLHRNGSLEDWKHVGGSSLLGLAMASDGSVLVCDAEKGLLKVGDSGVTVLASTVEGSKIRFADDVDVASNGHVYFSDASTKFTLHEWFLDFLERQPHGRLLMYNPSTEKTSILLDKLWFANGVALSQEEDYVVVCETWKFRCLRHWIKGNLQGVTDIFIDNLPGGPDNVNLAEDGSYWIAMLELKSWDLNLVRHSKVVRWLLLAFPKLYQLLHHVKRKAMVVNVGHDGKVLELFDDSTGKLMSFITSAVEFEDHLYLGSLENNFIGKLPLNKSKA